jgi:glycosyltransferase involved in cell wall biosynthesis
MSPVKISICIPAYREPELMSRLLKSVFDQSFGNFEVIITDDSPDDCVKDVVRDFTRDNRLRYIRNSVRKGSPENWNESMRYARGDYIKIMHHDDWFATKDSLEQFVRSVDSRPEVEFAFSSSLNIHRDEQIQSIHRLSQEDLRLLRKDPNNLFHKVGIGSPSATIFRRGLGIEFDPRLQWTVDIDFYIRMLSRVKGYEYIDKPLVCVSDLAGYRVTRVSNNVKEIDLFEHIYLFKKIQKGAWSDFRYFNFLFRRLVLKYNVLEESEVIDLGIPAPLPIPLRAAIAASRLLKRIRSI